MAPRDRSLYPGLALAAFCALVFVSALNFGFVTGDDASHVTENPVLRGTLWDLWLAPFQVPGLYMPTTYTLWWATAKASLAATGKLHPAWFHALNWAMHSANVWLAFLCFRKVGLTALGGAAAALVFGLHPIQVESVAWVTALKDVLTGTFVLASALLALDGKWRLATLAFVLAVLAKPVGAVTPVLVGLLLTFSGRLQKRQGYWLASWLVLSAAVLAWTKALQPSPSYTLVERAHIAIDALIASAAKTFIPVGLTLDYGRAPSQVLAHGPWIALAGVLVGAALLWRHREKRWLLVAVPLFLTPWLPVSGVVSFFHQKYSTTADRFLYLSMLGPALAAGFLLQYRKTPAVLLTLVLAGLTLAQLPYWKNDVTLYGRMSHVNPTAENLYRYAMALVGAGRQAEAIPPLRRAVALDPTDPRYANNLALVHAERGNVAEAEKELREALSHNPDSETLRANLEMLERRRAALGSLGGSR